MSTDEGRMLEGKEQWSFRYMMITLIKDGRQFPPYWYSRPLTLKYARWYQNVLVRNYWQEGKSVKRIRHER